MSGSIASPADIMLMQVPKTAAVGAGATGDAEGRKRAIAQSAKDFEGSFLSMMLKPMFEGLSTEAPFGGGDAEGMWRSFLTDAIAKQTVKAGGIGLADTVQREMLKMQGLSTEGSF